MSSTTNANATHAGTATDFLRSVNLKYDVAAPARIGHFRPTSKSIDLINKLVFDSVPESYLVVAPYGSGKSLLATFVAQVVENSEAGSDILQLVARRAESFALDTSEKLSQRLDLGQLVRHSGLAIVLHGYQADLAKALRESLNDAIQRTGLPREFLLDLSSDANDLESTLRLLSESKANIKRAGAQVDRDVERVVVLWDEFGRHLEELIASGDAARLNEVQLLAEFVARQKTIPFCLAVFLHQSLANYASSLSQTVRKEWKKIEGRFETVQFVDDSVELTALVADIVDQSRPAEHLTSARAVENTLSWVRSVGLFSDFDDTTLENVLQKAYPLEPTTLYLLPRVSARVAQNERTLFSFLFSVDLRLPVTPTELFDFFDDEMRSDTGVGGSYHQWLETQNAIERAADDNLVDVVKAAALLGLGISGQRSRVAKELLEVAVAGYRLSHKEAAKLVEQLIQQKLLLYRRTTNEVAIWHGVDIDLRGRLEQEKARVGLSFNTVEFISEELPARPLLPLEYNAQFRITRYFSARYVSANEVASAAEDAALDLVDGADGAVLHVVPDDADDLAAIMQSVRQQQVPERLLVTVPKKPVPVYDAALEVFTLRKMQDDDALTGEDPLVLPELKQMTDDALEYLRRAIMRLTEPGSDGPLWLCGAEEHSFKSERELRRFLSSTMGRIFSNTPRINNELIVRKKPRQVIVNARKALVGGILDRYGHQDLGLEGYRPDRSMLNTVLLHTGLYAQNGEAWHFADPKEIQDANLRRIWALFRNLVAKPAKRPKDLQKFFSGLQQPPVGLRPGVFPILLAAALRAFPSVISITRDGHYVPDITQSVIESLCSEPSKYEFLVLDMQSEVTSYLSQVRGCFARNPAKTSETDHLRMTYDTVQRWLSELPPAALSTRRLSKTAIRLRGLLTGFGDPVDLFLRRLPKEFGAAEGRFELDLSELSRAIQELEEITKVYYEFAEAALRDTLQIRNGSQITTQVQEWTTLVPSEAAKTISNTLARSLYTRMCIDYDSPRRLIDSVASLLVDRTVNRWDDSTLSAFDRALRSTVSQIEEYALEVAKEEPSLARDLSRLAELRIENLYKHLKEIVGPEKARKRLISIARKESQK